MKKRPVPNIIITVILTLIVVGSFGYYLRLNISERGVRLGYAANDRKDVQIYVQKGGSMSEAAKIPRGTRIKRYSEDKIIGGNTYAELIDAEKMLGKDNPHAGDEIAFYMSAENFTTDKNDIVREKEKYVRTSATLYKNANGPEIASFAPKGSLLKIVGFEKMQEDGSIEKYKVSEGEGDDASEGYVYSRYLCDSEEEAEAVYNEGGVYDNVKNDKYGMELYGGLAAHLDYYPRERVTFADNEFCADARAMYINGVAAVNPSGYVKIIDGTDCNAVVIDIKDGYLSYKSDVAKEMSPSSYKTAYASVKDFKKGVDAYRKTGAYLIGRIVVFNDPVYADDHPEDCIKYGKDSGWPSAYSRKVWEYNVKLAIEASEKFGFNEIQFDYVRFPESSYQMSKSGKADFRNVYDEEKGQAVQNFCIYAADMLHEHGIYMSVDVFGESAYGYMTAYGQYWPGISNVVDAISAMPYTDHMGSEGSWEDPYKTMLAWSQKARAQQDKLDNPAAARTWITGYNTPHWDPVVDYDAKKLKEQVNALKKAGLTGGFIPWNAASDLAKYRQYKSVWNSK